MPCSARPRDRGRRLDSTSIDVDYWVCVRCQQVSSSRSAWRSSTKLASRARRSSSPSEGGPLPSWLRSRPANVATGGAHFGTEEGSSTTWSLRQAIPTNGRPCGLEGAARYPSQVVGEERGITDKVEEVIEAAARIAGRPLVQLRLHPEYPPLGLIEVGPRRAGVHQRPPRSAWMLRTRWGPSPCGRLSRPRTTTAPPPHPGAIGWQQAFLLADWQPARLGAVGVVPTFTIDRSTGEVPSYAPGNIAMPTPQVFNMASRQATITHQGVPRGGRVRVAAQPRSARFELVESP